MTFGGSNFTNFPESCVGLTSLGLYDDKASISRFIFYLYRPFPFFTCISERSGS